MRRPHKAAALAPFIPVYCGNGGMGRAAVDEDLRSGSGPDTIKDTGTSVPRDKIGSRWCQSDRVHWGLGVMWISVEKGTNCATTKIKEVDEMRRINAKMRKGARGIGAELLHREFLGRLDLCFFSFLSFASSGEWSFPANCPSPSGGCVPASSSRVLNSFLPTRLRTDCTLSAGTSLTMPFSCTSPAHMCHDLEGKSD